MSIEEDIAITLGEKEKTDFELELERATGLSMEQMRESTLHELRVHYEKQLGPTADRMHGVRRIYIPTLHTYVNFVAPTEKKRNIYQRMLFK